MVPALSSQYAILEFIQWIKNPPLDYLMLVITNIGSETFYSVALVILFWYSKEKQTYYSAFMLMVTFILMDVLKNYFGMHRPLVAEAKALGYHIRIIGASTGGGYGLPSGHTMASFVFWYFIYIHYSARWVKMTSVFFMVAIPFSRVYLGVHFPLDVVAGYFFAVLILSLSLFFHGYSRTIEKPRYWFLSLAALLVFLLAVGTYPTETVYKSGGSLAGLLVSGFLLGSLTESGRALTVRTGVIGLLGIIIILAAKTGLKKILEPVFTLASVADFIRYFIVALAGFYLVPVVFRKKGN